MITIISKGMCVNMSLKNEIQNGKEDNSSHKFWDWTLGWGKDGQWLPSYPQCDLFTCYSEDTFETYSFDLVINAFIYVCVWNLLSSSIQFIEELVPKTLNFAPFKTGEKILGDRSCQVVGLTNNVVLYDKIVGLKMRH